MEEKYQGKYYKICQIGKLILKLVLNFFMQALILFFVGFGLELLEVKGFLYVRSNVIICVFFGIPMIFIANIIYKIKPLENKVMSIIYWVVVILAILDYVMYFLEVYIGLFLRILEWLLECF